MKAVFTIPTGAVVEIETKDGKKLTNDQIKSVAVTPFFSFANAQGELFQITTQNKHGDVIERKVVAASGANGKLSLRAPVEASVEPLIDRKLKLTVKTTEPTK